MKNHNNQAAKNAASSIISSSRSPGSVPALDRTLDILEILRDSPQGLTLSQLGHSLKIPKNAVFRITQTLLAREYLIREPDTMAFQLTGKWMKFAPQKSQRASLPELAREPMKTLRNVTRETVQLGVLAGTEGIIIDQVEGLEALRIAVDPGLRFPLHNNAPGKLLLAYLPKQDRENLLSEINLTASTPRTITRKKALQAECEKIFQQGYSTDYAEADEGIHCLAAPILDIDDEIIGAVWISAPAKRLPKSQFTALSAQVKVTGAQITGLLRKGR